MAKKKILITGAGGFIGGHLTAYFLKQGEAEIRAVDSKPLEEWYQRFDEVENLQLDLQDKDACYTAARGTTDIYNLASDMGGMGFIENNKCLCMLNVLINTHLLLAARDHDAKRFFFASTACVYNIEKQKDPNVVPLKEEDAYPAMPEDGYGWEKLFSERMCRHFREDYGIAATAARFHNVYGPCGTWEGGREKAPAAICRKVIQAKLSGEHTIEIWGDGTRTRSFTYIDDCTRGIDMIVQKDVVQPINLGSSQLVTINQLVDVAEKIAGIRLERRYDVSALQGVNGRNSDNTRIKQLLDWEPSTRLYDGMERTYAWIYDEYVKKYGR